MNEQHKAEVWYKEAFFRFDKHIYATLISQLVTLVIMSKVQSTLPGGQAGGGARGELPVRDQRLSGFHPPRQVAGR